MQKNLTMKELPNGDRPYEKCLSKGVSSLTDAELLSVIIRTGVQGEKSTNLAERILSINQNGLLNLISLDISDLMKIKGIGKVKAVQLKCAGELARRISQQSKVVADSFQTPEAIADYYMELLRHEEKEMLLVSMYDIRNRSLGAETISIGTSNQTLLSSTEIFRTALKHNASYIVLIHNHPSGIPTPSEYDFHVTEMIAKNGRMLGIPLLDHIIIGDRQYYSFCEQGQLS